MGVESGGGLDVNVACRASFAVVKMSGDNLMTYLQGQITQDIRKLSETRALYGAVLNPQAKAITDFYILQGKNDEVIMICPAEQAAALVERLRRFMLGYQLRLGLVSPWQVISVQGEDVDAWLHDASLPVPESAPLAVASDGERYVLRMPEAAENGVWFIGEKTDVAINCDESVMERGRVLKGIPRFGVDWDDKVHPLNANLKERDGVSFDKGCYVGQEVTSRMNWRGGIKKKLFRVSVEGAVEALPCSIFTSVKVGSLTSLATDDSGRQFGIAALPVDMIDHGGLLTLENGAKATILNVCL